MEQIFIWLIRICWAIWIGSTVMNWAIIYYRNKILEDPLSYRQALALGLITLIPVINTFVLWATFETAIQMLFDRDKFVKDNLPDVKATKIIRRKEFALEFVTKNNMIPELDDYVEAQMLMGKLTFENEKES